MNQRTSFVVILLLTFGLLAFYWTNNNEGIVESIVPQKANYSANDPTITKTFTVSGPGELAVTTSGGSITVNGNSGNKVVVDVYIRKYGKNLNASNSEIEKIKRAYDFRMEQNGNNIEVYAKRKSNMSPWKNVSFSFDVTVPKSMANKLRTSGGSIKLASVEGNQKLSTSGGSIKLAEIKGTVDAHTSGGSVSVENSEGNLDLGTSGGSIKIYNSKGDINAGTSGGSITLENIAGAVDVGTSGGSIKISGTAERVKASTSGGTIRADVRGLTQEVSLRTSGGSIYATLPKDKGMDLNLSGNRVNVELQNFSGSAKKGRINGAMNGGGMPVHMSTSGGNVNIDFK